MGRNWAWASIDLWGDGPNSPPTGWATDQAGAVVQDTAHAIPGTKFSAALSRAALAGSSNNAHLSLNVHSLIRAGLPPLSWWRGKTVTAALGCTFLRPIDSPHLQAIATFTDARVEKQSTPHPGDGSYQWMVVPTATIALDAPQIIIQMGLVTGDNPTAAESGTCYVHKACLMVGNEAIEDEPCVFIFRTWNPLFSTAAMPSGIGPDGNGTTKTRRLGQGFQRGSDNTASWQVPFPCVVTDLNGFMDVAPGTGESAIYEMVQNGSAVSGISAITSGASSVQSSSDGSHHKEFSKGDLICTQVTISANCAVASHRTGFCATEVLPLPA